MIYGFRRMIYLLRKHDIISVPSYAAGIYHPPQVDIISKIYQPFRRERISLKKRQVETCRFFWSRRQDLNLRPLRPERSALPN